MNTSGLRLALLILMLSSEHSQCGSTGAAGKGHERLEGYGDENAITRDDSNNTPILKEDREFWSRFVEEVVSSSISMPPVFDPTHSPTPNPTQFPTLVPTLVPTPFPTPFPTLVTSDAPTPPETCEVDVTIECMSEDGTPCSELNFPGGDCSQLSDGLTLSQLDWIYEPRACDDTIGANSQNTAGCIDFDAPASRFADIVCIAFVDGLEVDVVRERVAPGAKLQMNTSNGTPLPNNIDCTVAEVPSIGSATVIQVFSFSTGFDLNLYDKFGSLTLLGCQDESGQRLDCETVLCYEYELHNIGTISFSITSVQRTRNDDTSLLNDLDQEGPLEPGTSQTIIEKEQVNLCTADYFSTVVSVEGITANGVTCLASTELDFEIAHGTPSQTPAPSKSPVLGPAPSTNPPLITQPTEEPTVSPSSVEPAVPTPTLFTEAPTLIAPSPESSVTPRPTNDPTLQPTIAPSAAPTTFITPQPTSDPTLQSTEAPTAQPIATSLPTNTPTSDTPFETPPPISPPTTVSPTAVPPEVPVTTSSPSASFQPTNFSPSSPSPFPQSAEPSMDTATFPPGSFPPSSLPSPNVELTSEPSSVSQTEGPTQLDSSPTATLAVSQTNATTLLPSAGVTEQPSTQPTADCEFDLEIACVPPRGAVSCNSTPPPVEQCSGRPFEMVFLFNGGDCSQSYNVQEADGKFTCIDQGAGVPTDRGEKSYIVVTDLDGETIFHSDWVEVGSLYTLSDGGNDFPSNQLITIFNSDDTSNPDNILQAVQYHSSCSQNLFLKDRFGASQLVIWVNEDQGRVSCFGNQTFELDITVPIDIQGGPATLETLLVSSNVEPFFYNLTDQVFGVVLDAGQSFHTEIIIPVDLTVKKTYNLLITVSATLEAGQQCGATELTSFSAGYPLPPIFPTFSPTQAPTGTEPPTPDPEAVPCELKADIECETFSGKNCRSLLAPRSLVCDSQDGLVSALFFRFTGKSCGDTDRCEETNPGQPITAEEVFIFAENNFGLNAFEGVVKQGEIIRMYNGLSAGRLSITISTVINGVPGTPIQTLERVDLGCDGEAGRDLTLLQDFGALQLTAFTNSDQGFNSMIEEITMKYIVENDGTLTATALSAVGASAFASEQVVVVDRGNPVQVRSGQAVSVAEDTVQINLQDVVRQVFRFDFDVIGEGTQSGLSCQDSAAYIFRVES